MGLIWEPKDVDFKIQSKPLTPEEEARLCEFIKQRKQEIKKKKQSALQRFADEREEQTDLPTIAVNLYLILNSVGFYTLRS